jgi:cytidylate kinase
MREAVAASQIPGDEGRIAPRVIAVDGSAASGKSTVGRLLARHFGYPFLDTGIMYRALTAAALDGGIDPHDHEALATFAAAARLDVSVPPTDSTRATRISVNGRDVTEELRRPDVEDAVSLVSRVPEVREALVRLQREIAGGRAIVMAGRDIGTVVLPKADLKVYLDASLDERARRRHAEFASGGRDVTHELVLEDLRRRDQIDSERAVSPLKPAEDALVIGTDGVAPDDVVALVLAEVE